MLHKCFTWNVYELVTNNMKFELKIKATTFISLVNDVRRFTLILDFYLIEYLKFYVLINVIEF